MNYYWLTCDRSVKTGLVEEEIGNYRYLPRVMNAECGHERWWDGGCVPGSMQQLREMEQWVGTAHSPRTVSEDDWPGIVRLLSSLLSVPGVESPWIYPGLRFGPAQVVAANTTWHYAQIGSVELFSDDFVETLRRNGVEIPFMQEALVRSRQAALHRYYELIPTQCARIADTVVTRFVSCGCCGAIQSLGYSQLLPELTSDSYPDFIRVLPTFTTLVSERVKLLVEQASESVIAIPSSKIGVGQGTKPIGELVYEAKFERQIITRRRDLI